MPSRAAVKVSGDLLVDLGAVGLRGLAQPLDGQVQAGELLEVLEQGHRGRRIGGLGQVVRHVRGHPEGVDPGLAEPQLEQRGDMARDAHLAPVHGIGVDEAAPGRVRGDGDRAGVGDRHRDRLQRHDGGHPEALHQQGDRRDEPLPGVVGLGAVQQEERHPGVVLHRV